MKTKSAIIFPLIFLIAFKGFGQTKSTQENSTNIEAFEKKPIIGFGALAHMGKFLGEIPMRPMNGGFTTSGGESWTGFGYGISIDYRFHKNFAFHFGMNYYMLKTPIAYAGEESFFPGYFILDNNSYDFDKKVGPFEEDYNYHRNTTAMRIGFKGYFLKKESFDLWYGAYYSVFSWSINLLNDDKNKTLGNTSGTTSYPGLFNVGADFWDKTRNYGVTIFFESGGAPVTGPYTIEDCILEGWTFTDNGGAHVMGTYRIGVLVHFLAKKQ